MPRTGSSSRALIAVVCVTAALTACASGGGASSNSSSSSSPVNIGGMGFLTGALSSYGVLVKQGMQLGVDYVNNHGGVLNGRKLQLDLQDTQSVPAQAISIARRFATDRNIVGVVGPQGTPDLLALEPIAQSLKLPLLAVGSVQAVDNNASDVFRVSLVATPGVTKTFMQHVMQTDKVKSVGLIIQNNLAPMVAESNLLSSVASSAGYMITDTENVAPPATDYSTQIDKIIATHPDAVYVSATTPVNGQIMNQARARGFKGLFIGGSGLQDPGTAKIAGSSGTGYETYLPYDLSSTDALVAAFSSSFKAAYPTGEIGTQTVNAFDGVLLLADAINRAKTVDRTAVINALSNAENVPTVEGPYTFKGNNGVNAAPALQYVYMGSDGKFTPSKPAS